MEVVSSPQSIMDLQVSADFAPCRTGRSHMLLFHYVHHGRVMSYGSSFE